MTEVEKQKHPRTNSLPIARDYDLYSHVSVKPAVLSIPVNQHIYLELSQKTSKKMDGI